MSPTPEQVQTFLIAHYRDKLDQLSIDPAGINRDFDFLVEGVIDSLGMLDMVAAIETNFAVSVDLEGLDPEQLTILGPLSDYIARHAVSDGGQTPGSSPSNTQS